MQLSRLKFGFLQTVVPYSTCFTNLLCTFLFVVSKCPFLFWCEKQYIVYELFYMNRPEQPPPQLGPRAVLSLPAPKYPLLTCYSYLPLNPRLHQTTTCSLHCHTLVIWQLYRQWSEIAMQSGEIDSPHHKIILPWEAFKSLCGRDLCFFIARDNLWSRCPIIYSPCMKDFGLFCVWSKEHLHILIFFV